MSLKKELQELAGSNYMKYFGVASVDRFANMPIGHRPNDLLPNAKSVIVMGMVVPEGAIQGNIQAYSGIRQAIFSYVNSCAIKLYIKLFSKVGLQKGC